MRKSTDVPRDRRGLPAKRIAFLYSMLVGGCAHAGGVAPPEPVDVRDHAPAKVSVNDYLRAESFLGWNAAGLVDGMTLQGGQERVVQANWINPLGGTDDRFWYVVQRSGARRFVFVDPAADSSGPAFDHAAVAASMWRLTSSEPGAVRITADNLPINTFSYGRDTTDARLPDLSRIRFYDTTPDQTLWECKLKPVDCKTVFGSPPPPDRVPSPTRRDTAFVRDGNLFVTSQRDSVITADSTITVLPPATKNGKPDHGYGIVPQECCNAITRGWWEDGVRLPDNPPPPRPFLAWSPDGSSIVTHYYDESRVGKLHLVETAMPRPVLHSYAYALPGDRVLPTYELVVYHVEDDTLVTIAGGPMVDGFSGETFPVQWSPDSEHVFFTRHTPDYQTYELVRADALTGDTNVVVTETNQTFVSLNTLFPLLPANWRIIGGGREVIWYSERSGWGHLYRYDAETGDLLNPITGGEWPVLNVERVDDEWVYFTALGKEPSGDPYLAHLYRAPLSGDTSRIELLTPEGPDEDSANHAVQISPSGKFILDTYSRRDFPGRTVIRSGNDGTILMELEVMDISRLTDKGWRLPQHFTVKARDHVTDLHGFLHFPSNFDPSQEYPVIDFIYPGPQIGPILSRSFSVQPFGDPSALAELGFIVFAMDAMGTPQRSKAFDDADYEQLASYALEDHILALQQLDARIPQLDLDRVGIYGHSGGGAAAAAALLEHGDFFDVGVAGAGNHDNRSYFFAWGNKYEGGNYEDEWKRVAERKLQGRLLITYGTMDDNVHPNGSLLLINELIKHNQNFDVLVLPNRTHEYMQEPYAIRRGWDYFVTHLLGAEPPWDFEIQPPPGS
ncbi:MAG: S9 family peptidase [Gemmatimonadota bacterium]|nr:S9 family peptidase [Gemmatimonadota bacterium]